MLPGPQTPPPGSAINTVTGYIGWGGGFLGVSTTALTASLSA